MENTIENPASRQRTNMSKVYPVNQKYFWGYCRNDKILIRTETYITDCPTCFHLVDIMPASYSWDRMPKESLISSMFDHLEAKLEKYKSRIIQLEEQLDKRLSILEYAPPGQGGPKFQEIIQEAREAGDFPQ